VDVRIVSVRLFVNAVDGSIGAAGSDDEGSCVCESGGDGGVIGGVVGGVARVVEGRVAMNLEFRYCMRVNNDVRGRNMIGSWD